MPQIEIKVQGFGAVERTLPQNLSIFCEVSSPIADVLAQVQQDYPEAEQAIERCACAIGEDIVLRNKRLFQDTQLVLLSPVAGG